MRIEGRRFLITGGSAGIGFALAQQLAERGAQVVICGRDGARLDAALERLPRVAGVLCDVGDAGALLALVDEAVSLLGGLDVLINNAGIQLEWNLAGEPRTAQAAAERMAREVQVNLLAPMQLAHLALPHLRRADAPAIVNVTSVLARHPRTAVPVYSATKAGLRSWTTALRAQLAPTGVRVVELVPPLVGTAMARGRDAGTIEPDEMARASIDGLERDLDEIRVGKARGAAWLDRLVPGVLARMLADG
jgi:uncharacterized oxidoreductase